MNRIDSRTKNGIYFFHTESGSWYALRITGKKITLKRCPKDEKVLLRRDNEEIEVFSFEPIVIGETAVFELEPLGIGDNTLRFTTKVIKIIQSEQDNKIH
ncbi:hypothetical protein [Aminipila sp.]|uniref:hypothetical protein n=1 Tax=Aminipila sp. TaxID=2060095 RepID=UPI00289FD92A|nr:hypothetical protein [Aminipila sp.]